VDSALLLTALIGCVSLLYATVGQAGGTAFVAVMALALLPAAEMRATALLLNIVAAGYATWRLHRNVAIEWRLVARVTAPSLVTAFVGGLLVVEGRAYFVLTGLLLILAAGLMVLRRTADTPENGDVRPVPAAAAGAGAGFVAGLTGVGGGVFLTPVVIVLGWASPRRAAALALPSSSATPPWRYWASSSPVSGPRPGRLFTRWAPSRAPSSALPSESAGCRSAPRGWSSPPS
jgi:uncharacterized membrane protein YfcA